MKYLYLSSLFTFLGCIAMAQLSIVPQFGVETSKTTLSYNNSANYSPLGVKLSPHASVRLDYKFKKGHGPFVGLATTRSGVNYSFTNQETGKTDYTASRDNKQLRLEGGYQVSTNRIYFNKSAAKNNAASNNSASVTPEQNTAKRSCRDFYTRSQCGSKASKVAESPSRKSGGSWMKIQPSAGMAFVPSASAAEIATKSQNNITNYEYTAGNWNTAFIAGAGFAFGNNNQEKLIVSLNYLKGIGNLNTQSLTTVSGTKSTTTHLSSTASNWNLRVGIPIILTKKASPKKEVIKIEQRTETKQPAQIKEVKQEKKCGASMYRCRKAA
jgi:hypothetical protein